MHRDRGEKEKETIGMFFLAFLIYQIMRHQIMAQDLERTN